MTLLGLGLGFIRGLFRDITETTGTVQEQVKQQILEDLKTGDKKLSFSTNNLNMESSGAETITIGVRNSKSSAQGLDFIVVVEALQWKKPGGEILRCARTETAVDIQSPEITYECKDVDKDGNAVDSGEAKIPNIEFFYDMGPYSLGVDTAEVYPIRVTAEAGGKGTYLAKISILENMDGGDPNLYGEKPDPAEAGDLTPNEVYAEKTFFINVN